MSRKGAFCAANEKRVLKRVILSVIIRQISLYKRRVLMPDNYSKTELYTGRKRVFGSMLTGGFAVAFFVWFILRAANAGAVPVLLWVAAAVCVPPGLIMFTLAAVRLIKPQRVLLIDNEGITDYSVPGAPCRVPWSHVEDAVSYKMGRQLMLGVRVFDAAEVLKQMNPFKRLLYKMNQTNMRLLINIPQELLDVPVQEAVNVIMEYKRISIQS